MPCTAVPLILSCKFWVRRAATIFCRRWNSGLQELMQKDVNDANTEYCTVTFSVGFTKAPHVVLSINDSSGKTGWLTVIAPRQITTTNFLISRNSTLNKTLVFTAYGRGK